MGKKDETTPIDEIKIGNFLEKFLSGIGVRQRYSAQSHMVVERLDTLFDLVQEIFEQTNPVTFSEFHNHLMINDSPLSVNFSKTPLVGAFIFFMLQHNLQKLLLDSHCTKDDLSKLIGLFAEQPELIRATPQKALLDNSIKGVEIEPQGKAKRRGEPTNFFYVTDPEMQNLQKNQTKKSKTDAPAAITTPQENKPVPDFESKTRITMRPDLAAEMKAGMETDQTRKIHRSGTEAAEATVIQRRTDIFKQAEKASDKTMLRKRIIEKTRPEGTVNLVVMVKLGRQYIDEATVVVLGDPDEVQTTDAQNGASFYLLPGSYRVRVTYDNYMMVYDIELFADVDSIQMDANLLDATV